MPMSTKMQTEVVRNVLVEVRSIGPTLSGGIWSVPFGKIEKCTWRIGQHVRCDVRDDHVGHEDAEGEGGQRQVEAAQPQGGEGDQAADERGDHHAEEQPHSGDPLGGGRCRRARGGTR